MLGTKVNPELERVRLVLDRNVPLLLVEMLIKLEYVPAVIVMGWSLLNEMYRLFWTKVRTGAELPCAVEAE